MLTDEDGVVWDDAVELTSLEEVASALLRPFRENDDSTWLTEQMMWIYAWAEDITFKVWNDAGTLTQTINDGAGRLCYLALWGNHYRGLRIHLPATTGSYSSAAPPKSSSSSATPKSKTVKLSRQSTRPKSKLLTGVEVIEIVDSDSEDEKAKMAPMRQSHKTMSNSAHSPPVVIELDSSDEEDTWIVSAKVMSHPYFPVYSISSASTIAGSASPRKIKTSKRITYSVGRHRPPSTHSRKRKRGHRSDSPDEDLDFVVKDDDELLLTRCGHRGAGVG